MSVSRSLRCEILRRDGFRCVYCGQGAADGAALEIDHIVPVALGGTHDPLNLATSCHDCNSGKAASINDADSHVSDVLVTQLETWRDGALARLQALEAEQEIERIAATRRDDIDETRRACREATNGLLTAWEKADALRYWDPPQFFPLLSTLIKTGHDPLVVCQAVFDAVIGVLERGRTGKGPIPDDEEDPTFLARYSFGVIRHYGIHAGAPE